MSRLLLPLLVLLLGSCASDITELVLVVDSDLPVPDELRQVDLQVRGPDGTMVVDTTIAFDLPGAPFMPLSLGFVLEGPETGPFRVDATGTTRAGSTIRRSVVTNFVDNGSRALPLRLYERCLDVTCDAGQTCGDSGACESDAVDGEFLPQWSGNPEDFGI